MGCGTMMDGMGMMMWFSFMLGLLLIVFIVLAIIALVRWMRGDKFPTIARREDAVAILKKRYAGGEIDRDEYEKIRKDIE
jgi:putative membrane protein